MKTNMRYFGFQQKRFLLTLSLITLFYVIPVACNTMPNEAQPDDHEEPAMENINGGVYIVGKWRKISTTKCDNLYPSELDFLDDGIYLTPMRNDVFILWQSGDYKIVEENRIEIQSATDAMLQYNFFISVDDVLAFSDDQGCEFKYERVE